MHITHTHKLATSAHASPQTAFEWFKGRVQHLLRYDGEHLYWNETRCRYRKKGDFAGHVKHGHRFVKLDGHNYSARRICWLLKYGWLPEKVHYLEGADNLNLNNLYV